MKRWNKSVATMASGGALFGLAQSFDLINFSQVLTSFLSVLFSALVSLFLGTPA